MAIHSAAGTTVSIAAVAMVGTVDLSTLSAKTYTPIGEVVSIGDFGKTYNVVKHSPIGDRNVRKLKGSYDAGTMSFEFASQTSDAGQIILKTASDSDLSYAMRIVENDGTTSYFTCQVVSFVKKIGSVDSIVGGTANIEIDSPVY